FLYFMIATYGVLLVHELGHLLTGLAQGFSFQLLVVGFLGVRREEDGSIRPYFNKEWTYHGGVALTTPTTYSEQTATQFGRVLLAGPLASLLLMILLWALAPLVAPAWKFILLTTGFISFGLFLATTLPGKTGIFYTDRKRYQRLMKTGPTREIELALLQAISLKLQQKPITDMAATDLEKITEDPSPMFQYTGLYYLCEYFANDPEKFAEIRARMAPVEAELPAGYVKQMQVELDKLAPSPSA
ncbi:MAG: site-2 protease family protein, partial [Bacteroidota bacterium]